MKSAGEMRLEGGCYCGATRYIAEGKPMLRAQCHCRECQYFSGGGPNFFLLTPLAGFRYVKGEVQRFSRNDIDNAVTREFCPHCGTHLTTRRPGLDAVILKAGTLDDPAMFGNPKMAIFTIDAQPFHHIPQDMPNFERLPER